MEKAENLSDKQVGIETGKSTFLWSTGLTIQKKTGDQTS